MLSEASPGESSKSGFVRNNVWNPQTVRLFLRLRPPVNFGGEKAAARSLPARLHMLLWTMPEFGVRHTSIWHPRYHLRGLRASECMKILANHMTALRLIATCNLWRVPGTVLRPSSALGASRESLFRRRSCLSTMRKRALADGF